MIPPLLKAGERKPSRPQFDLRKLKLNLSEGELAEQKSIEEIIDEGEELDESIERLEKSIIKLKKKEDFDKRRRKKLGVRKVPKLYLKNFG